MASCRCSPYSGRLGRSILPKRSTLRSEGCKRDACVSDYSPTRGLPPLILWRRARGLVVVVGERPRGPAQCRARNRPPPSSRTGASLNSQGLSASVIPGQRKIRGASQRPVLQLASRHIQLSVQPSTAIAVIGGGIPDYIATKSPLNARADS